MSIRLSREKTNFLARQVLDYLFEDEEVEFLDEPNEIRLSIVRSIEDELKLYDLIDQRAIEKIKSQKKAIKEGSREWLYDLIDQRAIEKIKSQKKAIKEGSREWEILYRKYYNEEISKLGKFIE